MEKPKRLKKELGLFDVYVISTGAMISSGFFLLPGLAAAKAGPSVVLAYAIAGILILPAMEDEHFQVESLCKEIGVSERQLYRKLKALLNCTPAAYIRLIRLDRAKQLLEKKAGTVSEITFQVGYSNTSAFARAFREVYGKAPSEVLKGNS